MWIMATGLDATKGNPCRTRLPEVRKHATQSCATCRESVVRRNGGGKTLSTNRFLPCTTSQSLHHLIANFDFPRTRVPYFLSLFNNKAFDVLSFSCAKNYLTALKIIIWEAHLRASRCLLSCHYILQKLPCKCF